MKKVNTQFQIPTNKDKYPKEHNEAHKNILTEEITENFIEILIYKVNQNVQEALKKFQDNKNKEYKKTQKQISELTGALNQLKSKIESTINREINELRTKLTILKRK
jgi:HEPN domain-containing protein